MIGWGTWDRTREMTESKSVALPLGYTPKRMVEEGGFEPSNPKELIYSQPRLATAELNIHITLRYTCLINISLTPILVNEKKGFFFEVFSNKIPCL